MSNPRAEVVPAHKTGLGLNPAIQRKITWILIGIVAVVHILWAIPGLLTPLVGDLLFVIPIFLAAVLHGTLVYRLRDFLVFLAIVLVVSNIVENMAIVLGGKYYYTDVLGPKLFNVPIIVGFSYFAVGYFGWVIARILLRAYEYRPRGADIFMVPLIASFVFTSWDLTVDPINATVLQFYIWVSGGPYWGVPFVNYFPGWILYPLFVFYMLFSLYLYWRADASDESLAAQPKSVWYAASASYVAIAFQALASHFLGENVEVTDPSGKTWMTGDIYASLAIAAIYTLIFIAVLSIFRIGRGDRALPTDGRATSGNVPSDHA